MNDETRLRWARLAGGDLDDMESLPFVVAQALCLDLDGTVRGSRSGAPFGPAAPEDVMLLPNVEERVWRARDQGFYVVGISNQGVVGFGSKTEKEVETIAEATRDAFVRGDPFHDLLMAYGLPAKKGGKVAPHNLRSLLRKPDYGMLVLAEQRARAKRVLIDWDHSLMVGDRPEDEGCAQAAGIDFQWAKDFFGWAQPLAEG